MTNGRDLPHVRTCLEGHPDASQQIASAAATFIERILTEDTVGQYMRALLTKYAALLPQTNPRGSVPTLSRRAVQLPTQLSTPRPTPRHVEPHSHTTPLHTMPSSARRPTPPATRGHGVGQRLQPRASQVPSTKIGHDGKNHARDTPYTL